jgi:glycosyltransferase involved in cell wall biosynthesis
MKKVLMINSFITPFGGAETILFEEFQGLKALGYDIHFFSTSKKPYFTDYEHAEFFTPHYEVSAKNLFTKVINRFYNFKAQKDLERFLDFLKPDLVHFHALYSHLSPSVIAACKKRKLPTVMTFHETGFACPALSLLKGGKTYCADELCRNGNALPCITNKCCRSSLSRSVLVALEFQFRQVHKLYKQMDYYICPSQAIYDLALRSGIPSEKLVKVLNCVSSNYLEAPLGDGRFDYFLFVGRLEASKGVASLIQAYHEAGVKTPLKIVGTGSHEEALKAQVQQLGLENVEFCGFQQGEALASYYKNALAVLVPSIWFEAFGLISVEAMGYEKPVIAYDTGGIGEIVVHEETGLLAERGNTEALGKALLQLEANPDRAVSLGKNGRKRLESHFQPKQHNQALSDLYERVLQAQL